MSYEIIRELTALKEKLSRIERRETLLYQSGTWQPRLFGAATAGTTTYTTRTGIWIRVGRHVSYTGVIIWTAATGTGQLLIDGLLHTANTTTQLHVPAAIRTTGLGTAALQAFVYFGTQQINFEYVGGGTVSMAASGTINLHVSYSL